MNLRNRIYCVLNKASIPILLILFITNSTLKTNAINSEDDPLRRVISVFEEAVREKSIEKLEQCIAPDFSISTATMPSTINYIKPIFEREKGVDSIRIVPNGIKSFGDNKTKVDVNLYQIDGTSFQTSIYLDANNKIKYVDYYDQLYRMDRYKPSELVAKVPFEYINDAIIVSLKINDYDKPLRFLFDTGADGMAVTKDLADKIGLTVDRQNEASVVGTSTNISISSNNTVQLGDVSIERQSIAFFEDMGDKDGIIGLPLASEYIVKVDFDASELLLYSIGDYSPETHESIVPITVPDGIIHIPAKLDLTGKKVIDSNFVLDTGAGFHVVAFSPFVRKNRLLLSGFKYDSQGSMTSMGHHTQVYHGTANQFGFGNITINNMPITLQASAGNDNWNPGASGSIGIKLLKDYNFTINLVKKEIYMEKR